MHENHCKAVSLTDAHVEIYPDHGVGTFGVVDNTNGANISGGVVHFVDSDLTATVWYDEILVVLSIEDSYEMVIAGVTQKMKVGDMIYLPNGTTITHKSKGVSKCFYGVTPANWADAMPATPSL